MEVRRPWVRKLGRLAVSLFVTGHFTALAIWIAPNCPIRRRCYDALSYYLLPTGIWQYWTMFCPDPQRESMTLEAEVTDVNGLRHVFEFTRVGDLSRWAATPRFRHPKFAANLGFDDVPLHRRVASRHAVRQLGIKAEAYPLDVKLLYKFRVTPEPGGPPADPMATPRTYQVASYHFTGIDEVRR